MNIKSFIKKIFRISSIDESYTLSVLSYYYLRFMRMPTTREIERRKYLSVFDYKELANKIKFYPYHAISENNLYGLAFTLSREFLIDRHTRIEHGLYLGSLVPKRNLSKITEKIITFSEYRKQFIHKVKKVEVVCTGAYIQYAKSLLSDIELQEHKHKLGKVLLVFPSHSIETVTVSFQVDEFIRIIESKKKNFDSVLVCLYWKDIELGSAEVYEKQGYRVVTAGHYYDYYFLDRLKAIISLSDVTISNKVGTHVGYCIAMNKPHYIFYSKLEYHAGADKEGARQELNLRKNDDLHTSIKDMDIIYKNFKYYSESISNTQINCIKHYWGDF